MCHSCIGNPARAAPTAIAATDLTVHLPARLLCLGRHLHPYYPCATELIGGGTSTEDVSWQDLDARDPVQPCGQLTVASISTRGGSPFAPSGVLSDAVPLTGRTLSYPIVTIAVSSNGRAEHRDERDGSDALTMSRWG